MSISKRNFDAQVRALQRMKRKARRTGRYADEVAAIRELGNLSREFNQSTDGIMRRDNNLLSSNFDVNNQMLTSRTEFKEREAKNDFNNFIDNQNSTTDSFMKNALDRLDSLRSRLNEFNNQDVQNQNMPQSTPSYEDNFAKYNNNIFTGSNLGPASFTDASLGRLGNNQLFSEMQKLI